MEAKRKVYTPEFKLAAVKMVTEQKLSVAYPSGESCSICEPVEVMTGEPDSEGARQRDDVAAHPG